MDLFPAKTEQAHYNADNDAVARDEEEAQDGTRVVDARETHQGHRRNEHYRQDVPSFLDKKQLLLFEFFAEGSVANVQSDWVHVARVQSTPPLGKLFTAAAGLRSLLLCFSLICGLMMNLGLL